MRYQLIAFDMDGTLLDSNKKILPSSLAAIADAADAGKTVILSTGRCLPELREYLPLLTQVRYLNCISGALVVDRQTNTAIYSCSLATTTCRQILDFVEHQDIMVHLLGETTSIIQRSHCQNMAHFGMGQYQGLFERNAEQWEDLFAQYRENPFPVAKLNLYFTGPESLHPVFAVRRAGGILGHGTCRSNVFGNQRQGRQQGCRSAQAVRASAHSDFRDHRGRRCAK